MRGQYASAGTTVLFFAHQDAFQLLQGLAFGFGDEKQNENQRRRGHETVAQESARGAEMGQFPGEDEGDAGADDRIPEAGQRTWPCPGIGWERSPTSSTHITGPSEMANEATKPMIANRTSEARMFKPAVTSASR